MCVKRLVLWGFMVLLSLLANGQTKSPVLEQMKYRASAEGDDGFGLSGLAFGASLSGTTEACVGDIAEFRVRVKGTEAYRYTWKKVEDALFKVSGQDTLKLKNLVIGSSGKYYCEVEDIAGMVKINSDTVELKVYSLPAVTLNVTDNKLKIAAGDSVQLKATTNADAYQWNMDATGLTMWVKPDRTTTYTITGSNGSICRKSESVTINVERLYVDAGNDMNVSIGQNKVLSAKTNADTIFWYAKPLVASAAARMAITPPATHAEWGTLVGGGKELSVNPSVSTVYTAVGYLSGFSVAGSVTLKVKQNTAGYLGGEEDGFSQSDVPFGISALADTVQVCQQDSTTLSVTAKGISVYDYEWHKIQSGTDGALTPKGSSYTLRNCDFPAEGRYYCLITDRLTGFQLRSDTAFLQVNERPIVKIDQPARDSTICIGTSINLEASSSMNSGAEYSWTGAYILNGETGLNPLVEPKAKTTYIVTADNKGCQTRDTVTIDVNIPFVDIPSTIIASEGSEVIVYPRDKNGNRIQVAQVSSIAWWEATSGQLAIGVDSLRIPSMKAGIKKIWVDVKITGCPASDTAYFKMKVGTAFLGGEEDGFTASCVEPHVLKHYGQEKMACNSSNVAPDSLMLRLVYEGTDVSFQWKKLQLDAFSEIRDDAKISGTNGPVLKFKPLSIEHNGVYICKMTNECNSKVMSDTFTVSVKGEPVIVSSTNKDRVRCRNDNEKFVFNVVAKGATPDDVLHYQWYKDGKILKNDTTNYLHVSLLDKDNMVGNTYVNPGGQYVIDIWNDCGHVYDTSNLIVNVPAFLVSQTGDPTYACAGGKGEFEIKVGGGGTYEYELLNIDVITLDPLNYIIKKSWPGLSNVKVPNITGSGKYIWRFRNECSNGTWAHSNIMTLEVDKQPSFTVEPNDQDICEGMPLELKCEATTNSRNLFYWEKDGVVLAGKTSATLKIASVTDNDAGIYKCFVYNTCTAIASRAIEVKVSHKPRIISGPTLFSDYCQEDTVKMVVNIASVYPVDSVRWYYRGERLYDDAKGHIIGSTSPTLHVGPLEAKDAGGIYRLEVMNRCGSSYSDAVQFSMKYPAKFVKGLDGVDLTLCQGNSQSLFVQATGTPVIRYIWLHDGDTIANGTSNRLDIKNAQLDTAGLYTCHVQNGCGDDITKTYIKVSHTDTFRLIGGGRYCQGSQGLTAILKGSDTAALYRLYKEGSSLPLKETYGKDVKPLRGPIVYDNLTKGTYYVVAYYDAGGVKFACETQMPGKVVIIEDPLPADSKLFVSRHMCVGDLTGDLALPSTQKGVHYYLLREKSSGWDTLRPSYPGTGNPLLMPVGSGLYRVYAVDTATGCGRNLSGIDTITPRSYPVECKLGVLNDDSVYCKGANPDVTITYACFEKGSSYSLWKNHQLMNPPKTSAPVQWSGMGEGIYNIQVTNRWGCTRNFGRQEVKPQELPKRYNLVGARTFCEGEISNHMLDLTDSDPGVKYSFYYEPKVLIKDTISVGGEIKLWVPLEERSYFVIATDTTPEHCSVSMWDTVQVKASHLKVTPNPAIVYVEYNGQATLNIDITGALGTPQVKWNAGDAGYLADPLTTEDPKTQPWQEVWGSREFLVAVSDDGCKDVQASVKVILKGGKLQGEIREHLDTCIHKDTIYVCEGSSLTMCSYAQGGIGNYFYEWSDGSGVLSGQSDLTYVPVADGQVTLEITSGTQKVRDSVYVVLGTTPPIDTLEGALSRCVVPGVSEEIVLKNSVSGMKYDLEYSTDGINYTYVAGLNGSSGRRTYSILNPEAMNGYVRVVATATSNGDKLTCTQVMANVIELRTAPQRFDVLGGWNYCDGKPVKDTIVVDGSQQDVKYHLLRLPGTEVANQDGDATKDSILFIGKYLAGDYIVIARIGACSDTMNGIATIINDTLPPIGVVLGDGSHCSANCPVNIGVTKAIPGIDYHLIFEDALTGIVTDNSYTTNVSGTLMFSAGGYCALGKYKVKAINPVTGCIREQGDIVIRETPDIQDLMGDTVYCESKLGVKLSVGNTEENAEYNIQKWDTLRHEWAPMNPAVTFKGDGFSATLSNTFTGGSYRLVSSKPCPAVMDSITVRMISLPEDTLDLQLMGNGCIDSTFVLKIDPKESGVDYTLRYNGQISTVGPTITATGIEWKIYNAQPGNYSVLASRESTCSIVLADSVKADSVPVIYPINGIKKLCQNDEGELYMLDHQANVKYMLYDTIAKDLTVTGTVRHDSLIFSGVKPSDYYAVAFRGSCHTVGDFYSIKVLPAPASVRLDASDCVASGAGWLKLYGLQDSLEYTISSTSPLGPIKYFSGDTLFSNLSPGIYCVTVKDTLLGCESLSTCDTILEGVPADSLTGQFFYCENEPGARLTLSATHIGIDYSILTKTGTMLMTISRPTLTFPKLLQQDTFIFRKENKGVLGTCRVDTLIEIKNIPAPADSLDVELSGGAVLCAGGIYQASVLKPENNKLYILQKVGATQSLDSVYGTGGAKATFDYPLNEAGRYRIQVGDTNYWCPVYLDTILTISPQPSPVFVDTCFYCYDYNRVPSSDSCQIGLRGMLPNTIYRLAQAVGIDTLFGPASGSGNGRFKLQPAGNYLIIAENQKTGCIDTMYTKIRAYRRPRILNVDPECGIAGSINKITTVQPGEAAADSVIYYVYKDGVRLAGISQTGDGINRISLGTITLPGVYKIYAERKENLCGAFMKDSVVIVAPLTCTDTVKITGEFCQNSGDGVILTYPCTVKGWKYYLETVMGNSDTIAGGKTLTWNSILGHPVWDGRYILKASNACGTVIPVDTVEVKGKPSPIKFNILNKNISLCTGTTFDISLVGSEAEVKYTVVHNGSTITKNPVVGTGASGPLKLGTWGAPGTYIVYGEKNGCKIAMDKIVVQPGLMPNILTLRGADVCWQTSADSMSVCLPSREGAVRYYLYLNGRTVLDSITSVTPGKLCFNKSDSIGNYTVTAVHPTSACRQQMKGVYSMHEPAQPFALENPGDTVHICQGTDTCLYLTNSEVGVNYILKRDGISVGSAVYTNIGGRLKLSCVGLSGIYRVVGKVGDCETAMLDSVIVKVHPIPALTVDNEIHFCEFSTGDTVVVKFPTDKDITYTLYDSAGTVLDTRPGNPDRSQFTFNYWVYLPGVYEVEALNPVTHCWQREKIKVIEDKLPADFPWKDGQREYLCTDGEGTCIEVGMQGSQLGVEYTVRCLAPVKDVTTKTGTGKAFTFPKEVCDTGKYVIVARNGATGCENSFNPIHIQRSDSVRQYKLVSVNNSYCSSSGVPEGIVALEKSQVGVEYELYRNGIATGMKKMGTGNRLSWNNLEGKPCSDMISAKDGYVYMIKGRDTLTDCWKLMSGADTIVAEEPVEILAQEPNEVMINRCELDSVQFSVTAFGCRESYQWYYNGAPVAGETKNFLNINPIDPMAHQGFYYCEVKNKCNTKKSETVQLKINPLVAVRDSLKSVTVCLPGQNVTLYSSFDNATQYVWYYKDAVADDADYVRYYYEINNFDKTKAGKYVCKASNRCNTVYDTCDVQMGTAPEISIVKAVSDTLCVGTSKYELEVRTGPGVTIEWYFKETPTGVHTNKYKVSPVRLADEGRYSIVAKNVCGNVPIPIATLAVDDTIKPVSMSDSIMLRCMGESQVLFINTMPTKRVEYFWFMQPDMNKVLARENSFAVGPFGKVSPLNYRVSYANSCGGGYKDFVIHVPKKISYTQPDREIKTCADCDSSVVLRLNVDASMFAQYEWYYRLNEKDTNRYTLTGQQYDTLAIPLCPSSTGYYYCKVYNRCERDSTTETSWVRIDSVPVVKNMLSDDTVCEGLLYKRILTATGGSLNYRWEIAKKDGTVQVLTTKKDAYLSSAELQIPDISMEYDSCRIICYVENTCGKDTSNTMLLRVRPYRKVKVTPAEQTICKGDTALIVLELEVGDLPWEYGYRLPNGTEKVVKNIIRKTDTIKALLGGTYQLTYIDDTTGCRLTFGLPKSVVKFLPQAQVDFSGGGTRCEGDTVSVRFRITSGTGPWQMTIIRDGSGDKATEIADPDGMFVMYGRDTTITFKVSSSEEYYIYEAVRDLGTGCLGIPTTNRVKVDMNPAKHIDFKTGWPPYIGQCHDINLRDSLKPTINGIPVTEPTASFYINGKSKNGNYWAKEDLQVGCYQIKYMYTDADGCLVTSDEIQMCVDSLPWAGWDIPEYACEGVSMDIKLNLSPRTQNYTVKFYQHRYSKHPGGVKTDFRTIRVPAASNGKYTESVAWNTYAPPLDSCMRYEIVSVMDSHGCFGVINDAIRDTLYRDTIMLRLKPAVDIKTRHPHDANWISTSFPIDIVRGDSVDVRATLTKGDPLWSLVANTPPTPSSWSRIYNIPEYDTIFALKEKGIYEFKVKDEVCSVEPNQVTTVEVRFLDTAYIRAKLWLEGPFDPLNTVMNSNISSKLLTVYGLSAWPATVNGNAVIDYVTLELRADSVHPVSSAVLTTAKEVAELKKGAKSVMIDTCLLLENGQLADRYTGDTIIKIPNVCKVSGGSKYYVVVRHRNHMGVMTAKPYIFTDTRMMARFINFTDSVTIYNSDNKLTNHMSRHGNIWLLSAGEFNDNFLISIFDPNKVTLNDTWHPTTTTYDIQHDVNFNDKVNWPTWPYEKDPAATSGFDDWNKVRRNRTKFSEIRSK